ncbi:hypothetical protein KTAU_36380 [Thermogemmatispora aurantia]|jgi:hypothetical protein|uniref:Uncharacterized protein n=1 Tax=Thermogemmatispora aurantia TaxID=2045279 RepID=A0A5J4KDG1_9CHLR|nr:hypothetical protein KTAU_36380 [Thermogemmatispora aurantia]
MGYNSDAGLASKRSNKPGARRGTCRFLGSVKHSVFSTVLYLMALLGEPFQAERAAIDRWLADPENLIWVIPAEGSGERIRPRRSREMLRS